MAKLSETMPEFTLKAEGNKGKPVRLSISGHLSLDNLLTFRSELESFLKQTAPASLKVDLAPISPAPSAS